MSTVLKDLQEKRLKAWNDAKEVAALAAGEKRSMDGEETRKWNEATAELDVLDGAIKDRLAGEQRAMQGITAVENTTQQAATGPGSPYGANGKTAEEEATELRTFFSKENRNGRLQFEYEIPLPSAIERRALVERRALGDAGGPLNPVPLPTSFVGQLYRYLVDTSSIRQTNPTVYSTSSGEPLVVPRSTAEGNATWTAEGAALTAVDPTLSSVTLNGYKVAKLLQVSTELLADTGFDIVGFMAEHAGRNLGIAVDTAYVAGTGTTQPTGFTAAAGGAAVAFTATAAQGSTTGLPTGGTYVGADVLIELYHSVLPQYRPRASYVMNDSTIKVVRKLKDTTGQYIWQPALVAGQPDSILGRPVYADPHMPAIGVSTVPIAFGDFAGYFIRDITPIRFERSDDFQFGNDLISFRAVYRTDGKLGDSNSIKLYQTAAT